MSEHQSLYVTEKILHGRKCERRPTNLSNMPSSDYFEHKFRMILYSTSNFTTEIPFRRRLATFRLRRNVAARFIKIFFFCGKSILLYSPFCSLRAKDCGMGQLECQICTLLIQNTHLIFAPPRPAPTTYVTFLWCNCICRHYELKQIDVTLPDVK